MGLWFALLVSASAHGPDAHRLTLEVEDAVVRATVTPGVEAFPTADQNGDGQLDRTEVAASRVQIRDAFARAFRLTDLEGGDAVCDAASVSTVGEGAPHVRVSVRCVFAHRPGPVAVTWGLPSATDVTVEAVRVWRVSDVQWMPEGPVDRAIVAAVGGVAVLLPDDACDP